MVVSRREKILEDWGNGWSATSEEDAFLALCTDDCLYEDNGPGVTCHGKDELRKYRRDILQAFPDLKIELKNLLITGNQAAVEWRASGTQKGDLMGIPATNKAATIRGVVVFELEGDRIKRAAEYWDMAALLKQLGVLAA